MGDYVDGIEEGNKGLEKTEAKERSIVALLKQELSLREKINGLLGRGGGSTQVANQTSSTGITANGNTNGYNNGPNPYRADQTGPYSGGQASNPPKFKDYDTLKTVTLGALKSAAAVVAFLPTVEEATTAQLAQSRIKFFGGGGYLNVGQNATGFRVPPKYDKNTGFRLQRDLSNLGTALTPSDALAAINNGMQMGFLPSLMNYGMGDPSKKDTRFSGILGGAALASNLVPGIGLQGGMQAMGSLNQAQNVNMLRMLGVQVRNAKGTGMNDLPAIIEQIYNLLARGGNISVEDIATSLMPGNALDSLLNQYLGGDAMLKNVVIAGLVQRVKAGDLRTSGTKEMLDVTGGSSLGVRSISGRATAELGLIQSYTERTVESMNTANRGLTRLYRGLANPGPLMKPILNAGQSLSTKLDVYAGARGNAGQAVIQNAITTAMDAFNSGGTASRFLTGALGLSAAAGLSTHISRDVMSPLEGRGNNPDFYGSGTPSYYAKASNPGQIYTGAITVNVAAPPGQDPYSYGLAIGQAMTARS